MAIINFPGFVEEPTAVQLVCSPFSQFVSQLEPYSQLQLSHQTDLIAFGDPIST